MKTLFSKSYPTHDFKSGLKFSDRCYRSIAYGDRYPDVRKEFEKQSDQSWFNAEEFYLQHYLNHGRYEGRYWGLTKEEKNPLVETHRLTPGEIIYRDDPLWTQKVDNVNNPPHYTNHPSGVECIDITRHMSFNLGNAMKYIWRCDLKKDAIEDLEKAVFYLNDEIKRRKNED